MIEGLQGSSTCKKTRYCCNERIFKFNRNTFIGLIRLSAAVDKEDIVGLKQSGFRASRSCADNIFILNIVLEINKSKKLFSFIVCRSQRSL